MLDYYSASSLLFGHSLEKHIRLLDEQLPQDKKQR